MTVVLRFKDKERPQGYAAGLAGHLHDYPLEVCYSKKIDLLFLLFLYVNIDLCNYL